MKDITRAFLCITIVLGLVACNGGGGNTQSDEATAAAEASQAALPFESQLLLGTMKLDGTDLEVTSDQASELLTLWKAVQFLSTSDTTAKEELDAVIKQIQKTMNAEQLEAIQAMNLKQGDMASIMQDLGILPAGGFMGGQGGKFEGQELPEDFNPGELPEGEIIISGTPGLGMQGGEIPEGGFQGGNRPDGGFPGGEGHIVIIGGEGPGGAIPGGGFPGGEGQGGFVFNGEMDPEQMATLQAERAGRTDFRNRSYLFLIDPLIKYLEGKVVEG